MDLKTCTPKQWADNEEACLQKLEDEAVWNEIPLLNVNELHFLKDSTLVRFRGMIQDMHSPEYYLEKFEVINQNTGQKTMGSGKYCDGALSDKDESVNFDSDSNVTSERQSYVVVSTPGINTWVSAYEKEHAKVVLQLTTQSGQSKRTYEEMDSEDIPEGSSSCTTENKKSSTVNSSAQAEGNAKLSKEYILNFPLPDDGVSKTCHLKLYKGSENLKLNDLCEFVGFLGTNPITEAAYQEDNDFGNKMEMETLHPPSSLVPRIHCVSFRKLVHSNPLLGLKTEPMPLERLEFVRKELHIVLTQLLLGDTLAAEYLIYHLISEVYSRKDLLQLGKFSLNISNIPNLGSIDYPKELYNVIASLVTKSFYLPMTLDNMNDLTFVPKKDYECNRLTSGILQLSSNTHLLLDETKLTTGQLNAGGLSNMKALSSAIKNQSVCYDFNYYHLDFDCDIPFLILSEGKSLLNFDVHVVLKPEQMCIDTFVEILEAARHFLKPELLTDIRKYLTLARFTEYEIHEKSGEWVQNEYIEMKKRGLVSADDLHQLLVLARLVSISHGKTNLDEECWRKACSLESERKARISK